MLLFSLQQMIARFCTQVDRLSRGVVPYQPCADHYWDGCWL